MRRGCYEGAFNNFDKLPILSHSFSVCSGHCCFFNRFPAAARKTPQSGRVLSRECFELLILLELTLIRHDLFGRSGWRTWRRMLAQFAMLWSCNNIFIGVCRKLKVHRVGSNVDARYTSNLLFYRFICFKNILTIDFYIQIKISFPNTQNYFSKIKETLIQQITHLPILHVSSK